jgi:Fe-S cluster assembly ATPase SufC
MVGGKIVDSGGKDLAKKLEKEGYAAYGTSGGKIALE